MASSEGSDAEELEEEAIDRYAPSQAGRAVAGLQHSHSHSHSHSRQAPSVDTGTTLDGDDWHRSRSLFNVTWPEPEDNCTAQQASTSFKFDARPQRASSMKSTPSLHEGTDNNV